MRLADYSVAELRRAALTAVLLLAVGGLFLFMVHRVLVAVLVGIVAGVYLLPLQVRLERRLHSTPLAAIVSITLVTVPLIAVLVYSWIEISGAAEYLQQNRAAVAARIDAAIRELPYTERVEFRDDVSAWVALAADRMRAIVEALQETLDIVVISIAVFLFTVFYILTDRARIVEYVRVKIPGRYQELARRIRGNVEAVTFGALYATFLTQLVKSGVILALNLTFGVPLAVVLAIVAFFIGFFPIVGSWTVYLPAGIYLIVFEDSLLGGATMIVAGFLVNTVLMSLYLRPKIAAEKSGVLNFYWMFIALVTGVYTFGIVGILIGPILLGVLKAIFDTVTGPSRKRAAAAEPSAP